MGKSREVLPQPFFSARENEVDIKGTPPASRRARQTRECRLSRRASLLSCISPVVHLSCRASLICAFLPFSHPPSLSSRCLSFLRPKSILLPSAQRISPSLATLTPVSFPSSFMSPAVSEAGIPDISVPNSLSRAYHCLLGPNDPLLSLEPDNRHP